MVAGLFLHAPESMFIGAAGHVAKNILRINSSDRWTTILKINWGIFVVTNYKLTIEYDGSLYHGWQRQKNDRSIQGEIEKKLAIMTETKISLTGSGRTDAGVHAYGQTANFHCDNKISPEAFQKGLNSLLPGDIIIRQCETIDEAFHARYDAKSKIYNYRILNAPLPVAIGKQYCWHLRAPLNLDLMQQAANNIDGTHDFKAFEGSGSPRASTIRCIMSTAFARENMDYIIFKIEGNGFLRFMVRNIIGSLVDVGLKKISTEDFKQILISKDRNLAGVTAPPHGLFLMRVRY